MIERKVIPSIPVYITNPEEISGGSGGGSGVNAYTPLITIYKAIGSDTEYSVNDLIAVIQWFDNTDSTPVVLTTQFYNITETQFITSVNYGTLDRSLKVDNDQFDFLTTILGGIFDNTELTYSALGTTNTKLDSVNTNIGTTNTNIVTTNTKLDTVNTNIGTTNTNIATTNTKLDTVNLNLDDIVVETNATAVKLDTVNTKLTAIDTKLGGTLATTATITPTASELHLGEVGGKTIVKQVVFSLDTGVGYASGDVLADTQAVTSTFRKVDGTGVLQTIILNGKDDQGQALDIVILDANVSLGTENSPVSITDTDADSILGIISIVASDWLDLGGTRIATIRNIGLPINAASGTSTLYIGAICRGTPTHTLNGITARLGILLD